MDVDFISGRHNARCQDFDGVLEQRPDASLNRITSIMDLFLSEGQGGRRVLREASDASVFPGIPTGEQVPHPRACCPNCFSLALLFRLPFMNRHSPGPVAEVDDGYRGRRT